MSSILVVIGAVVVFAKLESYSWRLIGSCKGALGVIAVLGLAIMLTNAVEFVRFASIPSFLEMFLWLIAATVVIASLLSTTTKAEFVSSAVIIGLGWLAQVSEHAWYFRQEHKSHYLPAH